MSRRVAVALFVASLLAGIGCARVASRGDRTSLLGRPQVESVSLDVILLRVPQGDTELNGFLWSEVDEQQLSTEVRSRLAANGLRAGVLSAQLPALLTERLDQPDSPAQTRPDSGETVVTDFDHEPKVQRRAVHVRGGKRTQIITCGERKRLDELSVFLRDDQEVTGRTFHKVLGLFEARAYPLGDSRVRLEATPVFEHGDPQRHYESRDGIMRIEFSPKREAFESLKVTTTLAPGQWLLIGAVADRPGTLGYQCLTETTHDGPSQKFILIRLSGTQYDDLYTRDAPTVTEE